MARATNTDGTSRARKPIGKPPVYKTQSSVRGFLMLFERWAHTGELTDDEKAMQLCVSLEDDARDVLQNSPILEDGSYADLK